MFITTPFVRFAVNRLYRQGKIDQQQKDHLILQDRQLNTIVTITAIFVCLAVFLY